jgi:hypothetical protein
MAEHDVFEVDLQPPRTTQDPDGPGHHAGIKIVWPDAAGRDGRAFFAKRATVRVTGDRASITFEGPEFAQQVVVGLVRAK